MAILTRNPNTPSKDTPVKRTDVPKITEPEYRGATVDTRYEDRRSLITHIEGSAWTVNYFKQMLGGNDEPSPLQLDKDAVYQQYTQIQNLELKVTSPLSSDQREGGKSFNVTGAATVYPPLVPNVGDAFLADIGDGQEGVFSVTASRRMTYLKESVFEIEYVLVAHSTDEYRNDLAKKTVKQTRFLKELLDHGEDPVIVEEEYHQFLSIGEYQQRLLGSYLGSFYSKTTATLAVPDQEYVTYDPFVVETFKRLMNTDEHPLIRSLKSYSVDLPGRKPPRTLWDAIMLMSLAELPLCNEKLALVDSRCFGTIPQYEGVAFSNIDDVVYPVDRENVDLLGSELHPGRYDARDIRHQFVTTRLGGLSQLNKPKGEGIDALHEIHPVTKDDYYVFSEAFYFHHYANQSQLETITRQAMEGQTINRAVLFRLCDNAHRWGRLEKFYYMPILLILLKMVRQGG